MRTIERKILQHLSGGHGNVKKNLTCRDYVEVEGESRNYYLWNSLLFWNDSKGIYYFSGRGYNSITTRRRLDLILKSFFNIRIYQKNWNWFLYMNGHDYPIDSENLFYLKDNKLFKNAAHEVEVLPL